MAEFSSLNGYTVKDAIARSIAKGRNQALAYADYATMIEALNEMEHGEFAVGQNIYIGTVGVPDLWVYSVEPILSTFDYSSDEAVVALLENNGTINVGYYKLAQLEGQKVDLTPVNERLADVETEINEVETALNEEIVEINENMGGLRFGVDGDGNGGYYKADDSFVPFKKDLKILTIGTYEGERYSYSNKKTVNINSLLPDIYQNLTVDNFAITGVKANMATGDEKYQSAACSIAPLSYNAGTGVLTIDMTGHRGSTRQLWASSVTVKCFYVE